jgi:hypothetical protein
MVFLAVAIGVLALGRAVYPTPIRWRLRPWFVKTDRQGRITLAAFGSLWLILAVVQVVG